MLDRTIEIYFFYLLKIITDWFCGLGKIMGNGLLNLIVVHISVCT